MQDKKYAPFYLILTLVIEIALGWLILKIDRPAPTYFWTDSNLVIVTDGTWMVFLVLTLFLGPLIALTMSRKSSPILTEIRSRPTAQVHLTLYRFPVGLFLCMGFCAPALFGEALGAPLSYTISIALMPIAIVFLVYVGLGKFSAHFLDILFRWAFHWTGKLVIALGVLFYLAGCIMIMSVLRLLPDTWPYLLATFTMAYLPLRIYLLYWGHGTYLGLALIMAGMIFQQYLIWT